MSDTKIRAALLHLGSNMWRKKGFDGPPVKDVEDFVYRDEMFCQKEVWIRVTNMMAKLEFNTVVIDIGEGVRLDSHPEIATKGAWTKDELREELARLDAACLPVAFLEVAADEAADVFEAVLLLLRELHVLGVRLSGLLAL